MSEKAPQWRCPECGERRFIVVPGTTDMMKCQTCGNFNHTRVLADYHREMAQRYPKPWRA